MAALEFSSRQSRQTALSVALLGVLLLSVAAAWLLVRNRRGPIHEGQELIEQMRRKGLTEFWGTQPFDQWYVLVNEDGEVLGTRRRRRTFSDGVFTGIMEERRTDGRYTREEWQIGNDATEGRYVAWENQERTTEIVLENGFISLASIRLESPRRMAAPPGYVPEGTSRILYRLAAKQDKEAAVRMILNAYPQRFFVFRLDPLGDGRVAVSEPGGSVGRYEFDAQGNLIRVHYPDVGQTVRPATEGELREILGEGGLRGMLRAILNRRTQPTAD
jgi:YD repeat-containing protein